MGVLTALAASLFPDFFPDNVTAYRPSLAAFRQFAAAIDSAIPNAQDLDGEKARAEKAESNLGSEPLRVSRRLLILRDWSHDEAHTPIFP